MIALLTRCLKFSVQQILTTHNKKLDNLGKKERVRRPELIINLISKQLDIKQEEAFRFSLNHHILSKEFKNNEFNVDIDKCGYSIKRKKSIVIDDEVLKSFKYLGTKFVDSA